MRSICSPVILACVVLALLAIPAAASALTVTGISPARSYVNSAQSFDVYGTGFVAGAQVGLAGGGTTIEATQETFVSSTRIRCTLSIPAVTDTGPYDVGVVNPGGAAGYRADAFTVYPRPTVTSVSPVSAAPGDTVTVFLVTGASFDAGAQVYVQGGTTTVYGTSETLIKPNQIRCTLAIPASAYIGLYDVYVTNHPDLDYLLGKAGAFSVVALTPTITGISPATAVAGETPTVDVFGTGFANGAEVIVQGGPSGGSTQIVATGETFVSPTQVRCTLAIPADAYIGSYTAFVRNSGGEWVYRSNAFTVIAPTPSDVSFFPNRGAPGETLHVTVFGSGLVKGVQVTMIGGHSPDWMEIPWTDVTWVSPTEIGCTLNIPTNAYPGSHDVSVRNPGGDWVRAGVFDVIPPTPTVSGISPGMALPGQVMQIVYVTGTGFANGAAVRITGGTGGTTTVNASGETWVNASAIRCSITVPLDAWPGPYAVEVQNLYGTRVSKPGAFAVVAPDPTILGISPLSAYPGNNVSATVTGTRFTRGAEVALAGPDGSVINATDETWVSPTAIRCTLTVPAGAAIATYDLGVGNPGRPWWYITGAFTVTAPFPLISGILPSSAPVGTTLGNVTVTGTRFTNGAEVAIYGMNGGGWIDATGEIWVSPTQIRCTLAIPPDAHPGLYDLYVRNAGGEWVYTSAAFTVTAPAVLPVPPSAVLPTDTDGDGLYDDVNGNGRADFADVVLFFNSMTWIGANEPVAAFDCNANGRIDFADVVWLFNNL